jgi:outer membrane protein TolC
MISFRNETAFRRAQCVLRWRPLAFLTGCTVGPKYHTPTADTPPAYKELTPADYKNTDGWKVAQPQDDDALRGKWWEIFNDPELNALEEKVNVSNQTIASAAASFFAARAHGQGSSIAAFPTVTTNPSITRSTAVFQISQRSKLLQVTGSGTGSASTSNGHLCRLFPSVRCDLAAGFVRPHTKHNQSGRLRSAGQRGRS